VNERFGFDTFFHLRVNKEGEAMILTTHTDLVLEYYRSGLMKKTPFYKQPSLFKNSFVLGSLLQDDTDFNEACVVQNEKYPNLTHETLFRVIPERSELNVYQFYGQYLDQAAYAQVLNEMELIDRFINFYNEKAQKIVDAMWGCRASVLEAVGDYFYAPLKGAAARLSPGERKSLLEDIGLKNMDYTELTARETECLELLLRQRKAPDIADSLGLSTRTVEHYLSSIYSKLGCTTRAELYDKVALLNLIDL